MCSAHNKWKSSPKEQEAPLFSANFPFYDERDIPVTGHNYEPTQVSSPGWLKTRLTWKKKKRFLSPQNQDTPEGLLSLWVYYIKSNQARRLLVCWGVVSSARAFSGVLLCWTDVNKNPSLILVMWGFSCKRWRIKGTFISRWKKFKIAEIRYTKSIDFSRTRSKLGPCKTLKRENGIFTKALSEIIIYTKTEVIDWCYRKD